MTTHRAPSNQTLVENPARDWMGVLGSARIAVLGAGGCVGQRVLELASLAGAKVIGVRRVGSGPVEGFDTVNLDLDGPHAGQRLCETGASIIISAAPIFVVSSALSRIGQSGGVRVVACSSMSARAKLNSPSMDDRRVAHALLQAEEVILERNSQAIVIRPTMIYGHPVTRNVASIQRFARRFRFLAVPSCATGLRQPVHAHDVAAALLAAAACGVGGRRYELGGGERVSFIDMMSRIAASESVPLFTLPSPGAARLARIACASGLSRVGGVLYRLRQDQCAENCETVRDLGVNPRPFEPQVSEA
jgi:nucleoside-diphosphate-sugar epimerase